MVTRSRPTALANLEWDWADSPASYVVIASMGSFTVEMPIAAESRLSPFSGSSAFYHDPGARARGEAFERLKEISRLAENWDGYGGSSVPSAIVGTAALLLNALRTPPQNVYPDPVGTVVLEWESFAGRAYIELGLTRYNFYVSASGAQPRAKVGSIDEAAQLAGFVADAISDALEAPTASMISQHSIDYGSL